LDRSLNYHEEFHGTDGPIHTSFNEGALPIEFDFLKACEETTGITKKAIDPWSGDHLGIHHVLATITRKGPNKGKRSYAAREYYAPNHTRPNLKVLCQARVNKVLLDDDNKVTGVSITHREKDYEVRVTREVILSTGTVFSPHILELSGIGDPAVLKAAGIPCKVDNAAIGANLQDHAISFMTWDVKPNIMTGDVMRLVPEAMPAAIKQYAETKDGPLAAIPNIMGFYSAKSLLSDTELQTVIQSIRDIKPTTEFHAKQLQQVIENLNDEKSSNLQIVLVPAMMNPAGDPKNHANLFSPPANQEKSGVTGVVGIQNPVSRGYIHVQSSGKSKRTSTSQNKS
jgi:choline dehydrogenase-like flavoprotein